MHPSLQIDTGTDELLAAIDGRVGILTLNRPEARNALSDRLTPALRTMIARFGADDAVGAVLITGAGPAFCAGGDVKGMGDRGGAPERSPDERIAELRDRQRRLTGALFALEKPTLAALPGPAAGAGLALALACDLRIAAESAFVDTAYAGIGLSGDYGVSWLLTRLAGTARARELMFSPGRVDARRCEALGLVNRVVADDALRTEALGWAHTLAQGPTAALALMKQNLNDALSLDFPDLLDAEARRMIASSQTADHREAVRAFIEKRPAQFRRP